MTILSTQKNYHYIPEYRDMLTIYVGNTYIEFTCSRYGILENRLEISDFVKRNLTEYNYDHRYRRYVPTHQYSRYQPHLNTVRLPRYFLDKFLAYLGPDTKYELIPIPHIEPSIKSMSLKEGISVRPHQESILEFLSTDDSFKPVGVFTGGGKSFMAIAGIIIKQHPAIIVLSGLISQWYRTIREFTSIPKEDIYVVQGFDSLRTLVELVENGYIPAIVIFSTRTLTMYCSNPTTPYDSIMDYNTLMTTIGVGTKIIDEVHMSFNANVLIDIQSNIQHNIYLSATYQRSNDTAKRIFNTVFPASMIYGDSIGKKYTEVYLVSYHLPIGNLLPKCSTNKGYNHALYEKILLKDTLLFNEFMDMNLIPNIKNYYLNIRQPHHKLLILCATRAMVTAIYDYLVKHMDLTIAMFFSGQSGELGNENVFEDYECVVSTHKSCGTGRDIKNLKTCINTLSFSSAPLANQVMGRLRELPDESPCYVDMYNREIPIHVKHIDDRRMVYTRKAKQIIETQTT